MGVNHVKQKKDDNQFCTWAIMHFNLSNNILVLKKKEKKKRPLDSKSAFEILKMHFKVFAADFVLRQFAF